MSSSTQNSIVFVTGAAGFLGLHIVYQLLDAGYKVRGAARGPKAIALSKVLAKYGDDFQVINIPDISNGDFSEALKGVSAVIHTAVPLPSEADKATALRVAVDGTLHVLREAVKAGVETAVVTGSYVTYPYLGPYGETDYWPIKIEEVAEDDAGMIYISEKVLASQAVAKFAKEHPHMKVTEVNPPHFYGPLAEGFELINPKRDLGAITTDIHIYSLIEKSLNQFPRFVGYLDTRDIGRAHVASLTRPGFGYRRVLVAAPHEHEFSEAVKYIYDERPELRSRLVSADKVPPFAKVEYDVKASEKSLGLEGARYTSWKETVLDTVDSLLKLESVWKQNEAE